MFYIRFYHRKKNIIFQVLKFMESTICPNYKECALVNNKLALDEHIYKYYIDNYCCCREGSWSDCTRFRAKEELNFCPDFVLPDTVMTADEITDRFDKEIN